MKKQKREIESSPETFEALDRAAHDVSDLRPMSDAMRARWEAAKQTGDKRRPASASRRKRHARSSEIVPVSVDADLLAKADQFAKTSGLTRSRLFVEGLRLRMKS